MKIENVCVFQVFCCFLLHVNLYLSLIKCQQKIESILFTTPFSVWIKQKHAIL